ncbi:MAG: ATP-dependent helicase [Candidatus Rifleibacteriota bacterium]
MTKVFNLSKHIDNKPVNFKIDYENLLNSQQFEAVKSFNGPVLCIAGAGTGKTRTLIFRVARMIESGISPESILLLTFTRKAARNMLNRVSQLIGEDGKKVSGGTYHSFAAMTLRKFGHLLQIPPNFSIIDDSDCGDIINLIRAELGFNKKETRFPTKKTILAIYSKSINLEMPVNEIIEEFFSHFEEHTADIKKVIELFTNYKRTNFLLDYDDLLIFLLKLLKESETARKKINQRYRYIMADEYQDTNGLQAKITNLLAGEKHNVMVVGDDSQSIYSFRGAKIENILQFPDLFSECKTIRLEQNYRSTPEILNAANKLMTNAHEGFAKTLFTNGEKGEKPAVVSCEDDQEQALFVAARILELREQGISLNNMAVLFRSGYHAYQLELELKRRNIPYVKWGGYKFLESSHLKDIIAHLRILQNPADQVSWLRVLLLIEGIGTGTASKIYKQIKENKKHFELANIKVRSKAEEGLKKLEFTLTKASKVSAFKPGRLLEIFSEYYFPILKKKFDDYPRRLKDIDALSILCRKFESLSDFLAELALEPPKDSNENSLQVDNDDEQLVLSTIHSAKGLEWHSVFIIHALEGKFPSFNAFKEPEQLEEERRLMYVAMTRAEENLAISYPTTMWDPVSGGMLTKPSRFIEETDPKNLEVWQLTRG